MYRPKLTFQQLAIFSALTKSDDLKRTMIASTTVLEPGTVVTVNQEILSITDQLGSGLIGVVYKTKSLKSNQIFAYKRARAKLNFFHQVLEIEKKVSDLLSQSSILKPARILELTPNALLKEFCPEPTLLNLLLENKLTSKQKSALVEVLKEAAEIDRTYHFILDLSAKNLAWKNGWILLDSGPKSHITDFSKVLRAPTWENYFTYIQEKTLKQKISAPSVLSRKVAENKLSAKKFFFVYDWWIWLPFDEEVDPSYYYVSIDNSQKETEIIFRLDLDERLIKLAKDAPEELTTNPILQQTALAAWQKQYPEIKVSFSPINDTGFLPLSLTSKPITLATLASETSPLALAKALKTFVNKKEFLEQPTMAVNSYEHWSDLLTKKKDFLPTDIYCHIPLHSSLKWVNEFLGNTPHFVITPPKVRKDALCDLICIPSKNNERAIIFLPGFRASAKAAIPLIATLIEKGVSALFIATQIGAFNTQGQLLVTGGAWETLLLWQTVDYLVDCLGVKEIDIVAASYGSISAAIISQIYPAVKRLILDSSVVKPYDLLTYLAKVQGYVPEEILRKVKEHNLGEPFELMMPKRKGLKTLTMRPVSDRFMDVCGHLYLDQTLYYEAGHATTMRHDIEEKEIPKICLEAIFEFLAS
ncbi:MAG: alpha/beta hydrolase [Acidobacteria bacterium]|nr:alpha/beta hydrolase [Acidobacteriota bacterium]